jgi:hypothetical protein
MLADASGRLMLFRKSLMRKSPQKSRSARSFPKLDVAGSNPVARSNPCDQLAVPSPAVEAAMRLSNSEGADNHLGRFRAGWRLKARQARDT